MLGTIDERMQALARAVMKDASADADKIKSDAQKEAEAILENAKKQAEIEREEILERARITATNIKDQNIAAAQLKAQMLWIERREKLIKKVFETARQRIITIAQWQNYAIIVRQLVQEAVEGLDANAALIHADKATQAILKDGLLQEIADELKLELQLGQELESGTGIIAETMEGHRQFDNTFEARMLRIQDTLRSPVFHILMGESL
jgi:V/A-type H+-transporting ATPase subunit E